MKNILNYYYHMIVDSNKIKNNFFSYNNHLYCLYEYRRNTKEIEALRLLNEIMLSKKISINKIINNIFNQIITYYDNKNYVLIEVLYEHIDNTNIKYIEFSSNAKLDILKRNNWSSLWSSKIDYIIYQVMHIKSRYPIINSSINYYIGLAENAISYFNMIDFTNVPLYIEHRRINNSNMYNPLELVIDYKVRDIAEYIKDSFYIQKKSIYQIKDYVNNLNLEKIDYILLYIRLLFPSYYFDLYEKVINENTDELELNNIIELSSSYERLLYELYLIFKRKVNLIGIEWINNKYM